MSGRVAPPAWFRIVAVLLILWGLAGVAGFAMDRLTTPGQLAAMSDYDRRFYAGRPEWAVWAYGIATVTGLLGSVLLLLGRRAARPVYAASLVAVVALFGWALGATDLVAAKGLVGAAGFPVVIAALAVFQIALAGRAAARGWIG